LHEDLLPFLEQFLDALFLNLVAIVAAAALLARLRLVPIRVVFVFLLAAELGERLLRVQHVGDIEKAVALEAQIDEGRLHAGKDFGNAAFVNVADDSPISFTLDEDLRGQIVLENGHARFVAIRGNDHFLVHGFLGRVGRRGD
jgi:hypothetical protein